MEICSVPEWSEPVAHPAAEEILEEKNEDKALQLDPVHDLLPTPTKVCFPSSQVNINIYMYHYVRPTHRDSPSSVVYGNSITPETAREHYSHLSSLQSQNKVHLAFLSELEQYQLSDCFPHPNIVILSFDDGRRDNYHYLLPLAREFNIKANLGIIANRIAFSVDERIDSFMTFEEIKRMKDSGYFELQAHSATHTNLQHKDYSSQRYEICESTKYLEELFGVTMNSFIYPMGLYNQTSINVARDCGLRYALNTIEWRNSVSDLSNYPFELTRKRVHRWSTGGELYGW